MLTVNFKGCDSFIKNEEFQAYMQKASEAFDTLDKENGAGNDFLGWKHLPSETLAGDLLKQCEDIKTLWAGKKVDLVVVIGIGGSYLGAKSALEALSHTFEATLHASDAPQIVFAGQNLGEDYLCELMDLMKTRNVACVVISKSGTTGSPYFVTSTFSVSFLPIGTLGSMMFGMVIMIFVTFSFNSFSCSQEPERPGRLQDFCDS